MAAAQPFPFQSGFSMPAEWHKHEGTWIAWPHNTSDWPGKFHPIPWVFAEVVKNLSPHEKVFIIVRDQRMEERALRTLEKADALRGHVEFFHSPTNRCWTRDSLPTFVINQQLGQLGAIKWQFNAWAKYDDWQEDEATGNKIALTQAPHAWFPTLTHNQRVVLEGGAFDVNGEGLLLTTEECLLSPIQERNPGFTQKDYERVFHDYLGVKHVIWLAGGVAGDDTHGHVDDVARFVSATTIVVVVEIDRSQPHYATLRQNIDRLSQLSPSFEIVEIPLPRPVVFAGQRLPASYANFYIANNVVLVPTFNDPNDRIALDLLQSLFPNRTVIGIHCLDLVLGLGTLHCMTQQQPAVR